MSASAVVDATPPTIDDPTPSRAMPPVMITYQELVTIRTTLAHMSGQLNAALALQGRVEGIDRRLGVVENILSGKSGEKKTWNTILAYVAGVVSMALGGGAVQILPMLWRGLHN